MPTVLRVLAAFILVLLAASSFAQVTCVAVAPTIAGTGSGTTWGNAKAYSALSGSGWVRGDRCYLADGNYGTTLNVSTAASGTAVIEIRKAQSFDYGQGSSVGCSNNLNSDSSWNAGTMGSVQAYLQAPSRGGSSLFSLTGYITINGNGSGVSNDPVGCGKMYSNPPATNVVAPPSPAGCGIKFDDSTCTATSLGACGAGGSGINPTNGTGDIFEWTEHFGNGGRGASLATVGGTSPNEEYWMWLQSVSGNTLSHNYFHNMMTTYVLLNGGDSNITISNNYFWGIYDNGSLHSEAIQVQGTNTDVYVYGNILRDQVTNGDVVVIGATGGNLNGLYFYNNLDYCTNGTSSEDFIYGNSCNHTQAMLGCINSGAVCANFYVYNNTQAQVGGGSGGTFKCGTANSAGGTVTNLNFENNLFYNCGGFQTYNSSGTGGTWDYNAYLNSGQAAIGAHDTSSSSSPNPFTALNATTPLLSIASENALWDTRVSLGSPYDTDILGTTRTTDRGAYQFVTTTPPSVCGPPTYGCSSTSTANPGLAVAPFVSSAPTAHSCTGDCVASHPTRFDTTLNPAPHNPISRLTDGLTYSSGASVGGPTCSGGDTDDMGSQNETFAGIVQGGFANVYLMSAYPDGSYQRIGTGVGDNCPIAFSQITDNVYWHVTNGTQLYKKTIGVYPAIISDMWIYDVYGTSGSPNAPYQCPGLPSGMVIAGVLHMRQGDDGRTALAMAPSGGGQGSGDWVIAWDATLGCTTADMATGQYWTWTTTGTSSTAATGSLVSTGCYGSNGAGLHGIHDSQMTRDGNYLFMSFTSGGWTGGACNGQTFTT